MVLAKNNNKHNDQWHWINEFKTHPDINPHTYGHLILVKETRNALWDKISSTNGSSLNEMDVSI